MYITPVNFSLHAISRNKTANSHSSAISRNNSYAKQKNADTVSFSGLLRKAPLEDALEASGLSKKVQKGMTKLVDKLINVSKKMKDEFELPEPVKEFLENEIEYLKQVTSKRGYVDRTLEQKILDSEKKAIQALRKELSEYDGSQKSKDTIAQMLDFVDNAENNQDIAKLIKDFTKNLKNLANLEKFKGFKDFLNTK